AKALLAQARSGEVQSILRKFPASREYAQAELLRPYTEALHAFQEGELPDIDELDAAYHNAIRLASRGNFPAALDGLLDILRQNRRYQNGAARQVTLSLLEVLGSESPLSREYRSELASVLF
ncbi:MAG: tetratricopeptide repeat protein, partial [Chloroflexi bacterium]|nr:tetratricopeptide repeat protein [Chloroflexota bacterium]